jgi:simple sugar transport system permease protein
VIQSRISRGVPWTRTVGAVALAVLGSFVVLWLSHSNPFQAWAALISGAFFSPLGIGTTLTDSLPLMLVGIGVAVSFQAGLVNIGGEAQYVVGSIGAGLVGIAFAHMFGPLHIAISLLGAMVAGAILGAVPGILKAYLNVNEIVSTLMLSYASLSFANYLLASGPMSVSPYLQQSANIAPGAALPNLIPGTQLSWGLVLAPAAALAAAWFLRRTRTGFSIRTLGQNPAAARYAGASVGILTVVAFSLAGALAGLGGGVQVLGNFHTVYDSFADNYGFTGFVVALMARNNPWACLLVALLFGALQSGGAAMQASTGVTSAMVDVVEGLIIFFIAADRIVAWLVERRRPTAPAEEAQA